MAGSMNKVLLIGRIGQDPKLSYSTSGQPIANFSLATDEGYKDKQSGQKVERTEWHRIVCFRQQAEFVANYLGKGRLILVEGRLQTRKWQGQDGSDRYTTEIVANNIQFLDSRQDGQQGGYQAQGGYQNQGGGYQQQRPQGGQQRQQGGQQNNQGYQNQGGYPEQPEEDLGPAFPSEASGMDDVPF